MLAFSQKTRLAIYCLNLQNGSFKNLALASKKAVGDARMLSEKTGVLHEAILLASECSLKYRFSIPKSRADSEVEKLLLPALGSEIPSWFFFSAFITLDGVPSTQGYLAGAGKYVSQPKRDFAFGDGERIAGYCDSRVPKRSYWVYEKEWKQRGKELSSKGEPFLGFAAINGQKFECRVCSDVRSEPAGLDTSTIALVAANELPKADISLYALYKKAAIVNDCGYGLKTAPSGFGRAIESQNASAFRRLLLNGNCLL